ncbi:two-component sensor histidine kinase [Paraoerskovia sediminicola]|uniref:histidine kinase n=1 Tax=Paraoerskovia sediminicola TaxID=1138587 RepID=A0ABN6XD97_9CELL|nr:histidine kinase [Paraoerskovia sediminicola]BDZ42831.1 two-component sensor histidine kinase [Paraoerskovia sediminicola]
MDRFARLSAWAADHRFGVDAVGAAVLAMSVLLVIAASGSQEPLWPWWTVATIAPLAWRRTRPVLSTVAVFVVALLHLVSGTLLLPSDVAVPVALYTVTVHGPRWAHRTAMASSVAGSALFGSLLARGTDLVTHATAMVATTAFGTVLFLAVWAFGLMRRARLETIAALVDRAERLELERDQQATIAAAAERARIAREMHDVVAHSLSVIIAQADGGRYAAATDPASAVPVLDTVAATGRSALADMRRLLGVLRADGEPPAVGPTAGGVTSAGGPELGPQPGLDDLPALVEGVGASGTPVTLRSDPTDDLPAGLSLALFRVCQEALTNVLKHAGPGAYASVVVRREGTHLDVEVADDGRGAAAASTAPGYGLAGMRERLAVHGGTLHAGPRAGGGWSVRASVDLDGGR